MSVDIELTTESTMSSYGHPVLRVHTGDAYEDYLPGDPIVQADGRRVLARDVVIRWLAKPERMAEDIELGRRFLE
jgi:hypothetical protein